MQSPSQQPEVESSSLLQCASASSKAQIWDLLSKIQLTKPALEELNRRNRKYRPLLYPSPLLLNSRPLTYRRQPLTRRLRAEIRDYIQSQNTPASELLHTCSSITYSEIQAFARRGGPDLLDLRGVSA